MENQLKKPQFQKVYGCNIEELPTCTILAATLSSLKFHFNPSNATVGINDTPALDRRKLLFSFGKTELIRFFQLNLKKQIILYPKSTFANTAALFDFNNLLSKVDGLAGLLTLFTAYNPGMSRFDHLEK
jgi:hypothetical protein